MAYCEQLFFKLNKWQETVSELEKAKDVYLASFKNEDEKRYAKAKTETQKAEKDYGELKEKSYVEVDQFDSFSGGQPKKVKLWGPDFELITKICGELGFNHPTFYKSAGLQIKDERISVFSFSAADFVEGKSSDELLLILKNIKYFDKMVEYRFHDNNLESLPELPSDLEILDCWYNRMEHLDVRYLKKLKKLICGNNPNLKEVPELPDSIELVNLEGCSQLADPARPQVMEATVKKIKDAHPNCAVRTNVFN